MAERIVVLLKRPAAVKSEYKINFAARSGARPTPLSVRGEPQFNAYFSSLWQELEVHVQA